MDAVSWGPPPLNVIRGPVDDLRRAWPAPTFAVHALLAWSRACSVLDEAVSIWDQHQNVRLEPVRVDPPPPDSCPVCDDDSRCHHWHSQMRNYRNLRMCCTIANPRCADRCCVRRLCRGAR